MIDVASQLVNYFIIQYTMHMQDELIFVGHNICVVAGLKEILNNCKYSLSKSLATAAPFSLLTSLKGN